MLSGTISTLSNNIFVTMLTEITANEFRYVRPMFRRLLAEIWYSESTTQYGRVVWVNMRESIFTRKTGRA